MGRGANQEALMGAWAVGWVQSGKRSQDDRMTLVSNEEASLGVGLRFRRSDDLDVWPPLIVHAEDAREIRQAVCVHLSCSVSKKAAALERRCERPCGAKARRSRSQGTCEATRRELAVLL